MTTTDTPSRACYLRGCDHDACDQINRRYLKEYRLDRYRHGGRRIDSQPVTDHVRKLAATWSHEQIAHAARCTRRTISSLITADFPTIERKLAARILTAQPTIHNVPPHSYVNATGSIRRIQALIADGHSLASIAEALGVDTMGLGKTINHGQSHVTAQRARDVAALYEQWKTTPGSNARARNRARAAGWRDPQWWEDMGHLDDPEFVPSDAEQSRYLRVGEDAAWLQDHGHTREQIALRLGEDARYVDKALEKYRDAQALEQAEGRVAV